MHNNSSASYQAKPTNIHNLWKGARDSWYEGPEERCQVPFDYMSSKYVSTHNRF